MAEPTEEGAERADVVARRTQAQAELAQVQAELDVDTRFLLANERTLLAWVRTSLTVLVAGLGVHQFATDVDGRSYLAALLVALAAAAAMLGTARHAAADRAIRIGSLPPRGRGPELIAAGVALLSVAVLVGLLVELR